MSFSAGDLVFLKVSPMKRVMKFDKKEKLAPMYIVTVRDSIKSG